MKIRHFIATGMIAIALLVGTAGVAAAQAQTPTTQDTQTLCAKATARLPKLHDRITKIEQRIATLKERLADAQAKNQADRVTRLEQRIDWAQTVHDHLVDVVNRITARCGTS
jgi:hypothetical protein